MSTVLVRTIPTYDGSFDFVGIFSIDEEGDGFDLLFAIDEICDPSGCQYLTLPFGSGILFDLEVEEVSYNEDGENEIDKYNVPVRPRFSEMLNAYLEDINESEWTTLTSNNAEIIQFK